MSTVLDTVTEAEAQRGGRLVTHEGVALPLVSADLQVDAKGGLARVIVRQTFVNQGSAPVHVKYLLPLPADGAVSGFSFEIRDEVVVGQVDRRAAARERYEEALIAGRTAALLEQTRTSVFQQEVGNIPAGENVEVEIVVDQPLRWLDEAGAWEWRFPTVVGVRYQGAAGRVPDADRLAVSVSETDVGARAGLALAIRDALAEGARPESPSHRLDVRPGPDATTEVRFDAGVEARLDRDVVVRWPAAVQTPGASLDVVRPARDGRGTDAFGLLTLVPPAPTATFDPVARDLVVLIDTSGSMGGEPLRQAQRVVSALIDTLQDRDRIELIAFDFAPQPFTKEPIAATRDGKKAALRWVQQLEAGGGTEMRAGIQAALAPLRDDAQRQVVLITDGYIGFEQEIVQEVRQRLPRSCRLHTVGVGSSVNRILTQAAARAGAGLEVIIAPGEDAERAAARLVARTDRPVVTDLVIEGEGVRAVAPVRAPDLFAGAPSQISLRLSEGGGTIRVRGRTANGELDQTLTYPPLALGAGAGQVAVRFGRECVADLEADRAGGGDARAIDRQIEGLGLEFQIATRLTSWVAVSERSRVEPGVPVRTVHQPHEAPADVSLQGVGLRAPASFGGGGQTRSGISKASVSRKRAAPIARAEVFDAEEASGLLELDSEDEDDFDAIEGLDDFARELASSPADPAEPAPSSAAPPPAPRKLAVPKAKATDAFRTQASWDEAKEEIAPAPRAEPVEAEAPAGSGAPAEVVAPAKSGAPAEPAALPQSAAPTEPAAPIGTAAPAEPAAPVGSAAPMEPAAPIGTAAPAEPAARGALPAPDDKAVDELGGPEGAAGDGEELRSDAPAQASLRSEPARDEAPKEAPRRRRHRAWMLVLAVLTLLLTLWWWLRVDS